MSKKSIEERIKDLQEKQEQYKARENALRARRTAEERKQRTKRLVTIGASVESILGYQLPQGDALSAFLERLKALNVEDHVGVLRTAGFIIENVLGRNLTVEDLPKLRNYLAGQEKRGKYFSKALKS